MASMRCVCARVRVCVRARVHVHVNNVCEIERNYRLRNRDQPSARHPRYV